MTSPIPLPLSFCLGSYNYEQITRENGFAIYSQALARKNEIVAFELVRIKIAPAAKIHGKPYPIREVYPSAETWGQHGWTLKSYEQALEKLTSVRINTDEA